MSLKPFTYPFPETRFLHSGSSVYKFKIRYGDSIRGEDIENKEVIVQELEDSIRVVLGNLDSLQPFATEHFVVFPYKSKWERVSHLKFKHGEIVLIPYPFVLTLYVELKWFNENLSTGKPIDDSPLGLVPAERKAARAMKKKRKHMELSVSPSRPGLDRASLVSACSSGWTKAADANRWSVRSERAKMRTSSQGPSKKKFLMETSRNMERNTQQKCQETPAFDGTDVQEQAWGLGMGCSYHRYRNVSKRVLHQVVIPCEDTSHGSRWEDNLAGEITPPLQQSNPPPPAGPTDLGTSGFFGFLSSLFPFRYFFRKSSQ